MDMRIDRGWLRTLTLAGGVVLLAVAAAASASDVGLRSLRGGPVSLAAMRGNVVVLDFWAPWCIPCRKSFPFLQGLLEKYQAQGLRVVGLTLDTDIEAIDKFLDDVNVSFPIVSDPTEKSGGAFGVVAMPTSILLDREGRAVARFEGGGEQVHRKLEEAVVALLAGGAPPAGGGVRVAAGLAQSGTIKAWRRGFLADSIMNLAGDPLDRMMREHVHSSKEGAAGDGGLAGGGCGCN
jgi:cytochrome c biogenesis protein CcmG, thiol:disulfide interchange protein DsbE